MNDGNRAFRISDKTVASSRQAPLLDPPTFPVNPPSITSCSLKTNNGSPGCLWRHPTGASEIFVTDIKTSDS
jgi:hypothetical protein